MRPVRLRATRWALMVAVAIGALGLLLWTDPSSQSSAPTARAQFELTDHLGDVRTNKDFEGLWLHVFFGFTNCPGICPTTLSEVPAVMDSLVTASDQIQPFLITIDPERDTPEQLAELVSSFHPDIIGLSGTPDQVELSAQSFQTYYERTEDAQVVCGYAMSHSSQLFLYRSDGEYDISWSYGTPADQNLSDLKEKGTS